MKLIAKMAVIVAFATLASPATTLSAECVKMALTVATLDIGTRYPQIAAGIAGGYFERHCLDLTVVPLKGPSDVSQMLADRKIDGSLTIEPLVEAYLKAGDEEKPTIYGMMTYEDNALVGSAPISEFVGKVIAIGRCPVIPEHEGGKIWGDVTEASSEMYGKKPPSFITLEIIALVRAATKDGTLASDTRIICGRGFTEGFRPDIGGKPAVYIEEGRGALDREDMLVDGSVVATAVNFEQVPNLRRRVPDLVVYGSAFDHRDLLMGGLFAYPSIYKQKAMGFCSLKKALQEINTDLLAGKIADKPFTELTLGDLDGGARGAFELFEKAIAFDGLPNRFTGALTLKNLDGVGFDERASLSARLETFAELRQNRMPPSLVVTSEAMARFEKATRIAGVKYQNPCE